VAETVTTSTPGDDAFDLGGRPVVSTPAVHLTPLPADRPPDPGRPYWTADPPPGGFRHIARYQSTPADPGSGQPLGGAAVTADAYQAGPHAVWVEHRDALEVEPPPGTGERVNAGALGDGWLWLTPQGPQVRVATSGHVVVVRGTVGPEELLTFARTVKEQPG
jgi:hypothetical protein